MFLEKLKENLGSSDYFLSILQFLRSLYFTFVANNIHEGGIISIALKVASDQTATSVNSLLVKCDGITAARVTINPCEWITLVPQLKSSSQVLFRSVKIMCPGAGAERCRYTALYTVCRQYTSLLCKRSARKDYSIRNYKIIRAIKRNIYQGLGAVLNDSYKMVAKQHGTETLDHFFKLETTLAIHEDLRRPAQPITNCATHKPVSCCIKQITTVYHIDFDTLSILSRKTILTTHWSKSKQFNFLPLIVHYQIPSFTATQRFRLRPWLYSAHGH